jgi:hypothetical protein
MHAGPYGLPPVRLFLSEALRELRFVHCQYVGSGEAADEKAPSPKCRGCQRNAVPFAMENISPLRRLRKTRTETVRRIVVSTTCAR